MTASQAATAAAVESRGAVVAIAEPGASARPMTGLRIGGAMRDPVAERNRRRRIVRSQLARRAARGDAIAAGKLMHGGYSTRALVEDVADAEAALWAAMPWSDRVRDQALVALTARLLVRCDKLDAVAVEAAAAGKVSLTSLLARSESALLRSLEACGLSPRAAADLGLTKLDAADRMRRMAERSLDAYRPRQEPPRAPTGAHGGPSRLVATTRP